MDIDQLRTEGEDGAGTPHARLKAIHDFAVERLGHSPVSSKPAEAVVLERLDKLLRDQAAGRSITFSGQSKT